MTELTKHEVGVLEAVELIDELKSLTDDEFVEFKGLMELLLTQEMNKRFGTYERPEPRESNNY